MDDTIPGLLSNMFIDQDGNFYRWETEDMIQSRTISQLGAQEVRDLLSQSITFLSNSKQVIFGA
jgi:hypothetical protein